MATIFIIHGSYGNPQENWFPWLKKQLEKDGHRVFVPQFPVPDVQDSAYGGHDLSAWQRTLHEYDQYVTEETIFVAHSRGCVFLYRVLEELKKPVRAVFFVAPWARYRWYPKNWKTPDSFHKTSFDWEKIKRGSRHFDVYQSTNDEIPVSEGKEISRTLGATLHIVTKAGHFNVANDPKYVSFAQLYADVLMQLV